MAEITPQPEIDPDFEPLSRPRSCTWPLHRPEFLEPATSNTSSPAPSQEPSNVEFIGNLGLLEGTEDYAEQKKLALCTDFQCQENCVQGTQHQENCVQGTQHQENCVQGTQHQQQQLQHPGPLQGSHVPHQQQQVAQLSPASVSALSAAQRKSSSSRRNAWGNMSYADLITKAIDSSPEKRLTLSQIYDWMVKSVPYFKDKGDSNSSAGWKNSIRHNLSLHSRFVRVQNEGTGKSSWWMLNPDGGKNGKSPRRRAASMDNNSKFTKSRGRAAKKKVALQEGVEGGADSPGSQYSKWLGSPNSHSNDDFEAWSTFRTRTSSDASTLSGRHSPFLSEQDDLAEADVHMVYGGGAGTKMTATLPSLSEVGGTMAHHHHGSENVMESLHNLNLLSPKNPQLGSDSSSHSPTSVMLQKSPYSSPSMAAQQQDYRKCLYSQGVMNSMSPVPMQTLPDPKPGFGPFLNHYNCPVGLLKELLTSEADPCRDMMPSAETIASQAGMGGHLLPSYNSAIQLGGRDGAKMMNPPQPQLPPHVRPQPVHLQGPLTSGPMIGCNMIPLTSLSRGRPPRFACLRTFTQSPHSHSVHGGVPASYGSTNGYGQPGLAHPHGHHQERLPSDLDDMPIESLECDMESVLHDTLMDGDTLDFNFDPATGPYGFPQRVKTTTHSWVSG